MITSRVFQTETGVVPKWNKVDMTNVHAVTSYQAHSFSGYPLRSSFFQFFHSGSFLHSYINKLRNVNSFVNRWANFIF